MQQEDVLSGAARRFGGGKGVAPPAERSTGGVRRVHFHVD